MFLLLLLEGKNGKEKSEQKPWLSNLVDSGGLAAVAVWVCDDESISEGGGGSMKHPGVLKKGMLPQLMGLLECINFGQQKEGAKKLAETKILIRLKERVKDTGDEDLLERWDEAVWLALCCDVPG